MRTIWPASYVACALVACALVSTGGRTIAMQPADDGFKHFDQSIVHLPKGAEHSPTALTSDSKQRRLELHFALETSNLQDLQARVARGETISPAEMQEKYSGNAESFDKLIGWLKTEGFTITHTSTDRSSVFAAASVSQIEHSLGVKMSAITYRGKTAPAATTAPKLPHDVGDHVVAIDGLQPFVQAVKHSISRAEYTRQSARQRGSVTPRPATAAATPTYRVADILKAYNADNLGVTGKGQIIAILIDTFPKAADVNAFWQKNKLPIKPERIQLINVRGGLLPAREGEETLDAEWASGIASEAVVRVYASGSLQYSYLDRALDSIYADALVMPRLRQVSISLGLREDLVSADELKAQQATFLRFAALGVTVFVSSGDAGSNPDETGHGRSSDAQVEYEASDPYIVAVGGTTLRFDSASGKVLSETGWADSGGGISKLLARPAWQPAGTAALMFRGVPDVSCVADPVPGAFVWLNGREWPVGGTSWSAPVWAGFAALIAEAREKQGKAGVGFLAPALYKVQTGQGLRDIAIGNNGAFSASTGWDAVTGLGVPDLKALIQALP